MSNKKISKIQQNIIKLQLIDRKYQNNLTIIKINTL